MSDTRKVVINACYGGFGLSGAAIQRYAEIIGKRLWADEPSDDISKALASLGNRTYWLVPPEDRPKPLDGNWMDHSQEARIAYNKAYSASVLYDRDIPRDDPALVQVVEEMGDAANGKFADLRVVEIPADIKWNIEEYDGMEHISEEHRTWS